MTLSKLITITLFIVGAKAARAQNGIVNDLPHLSERINIGDCSTGLYVNRSLKWTERFSAPGHPDWIRAHITIRHPQASPPAQLSIETSDGRILQTFDMSTRTDQSSVWTDLFNTDSIILKLTSDTPIDGSIACLDYVNVPKPPIAVKSTTGGYDARVDLVKSYGIASNYYKFGESVVLIRFLDVDGSETNCTGVFLSASLVATNNHCIDNHTSLITAAAVLRHETDSQSETTLKIKELLATDDKLDYSILRVEGRSEAVAKFSKGELKHNARLIIIQHPAAANKMISVKKCAVEFAHAKDRNTDFFHLCDTSGGSSGSPVMDAGTGVVYGLHHLGVPESGKNEFHNLAVYMYEILDDLRKNHADVFTELNVPGPVSQ